MGFNRFHRPTGTAMVYASNRDAYGRDYDGKIVDENMIILRKRIQEMRIEKTNHEPEPPSHWMEWEKQYYVRICEAMELLQSEVMNTRPSLALGMVARSLIMLSVPTSMVVIMFHLVEVAKGILEAGITDP
jgi:hypothetical protein